MLTGRKYRLALTAEQSEFAETIGNICRSVWNTALEQRRMYRQRGAWMNYNEQAAQLADAKTEHEWLRQAPSHVLQQALMDLDWACREHGTFNVRWRSQRTWLPSFRFPAGKQIMVERLGKRWGRAKLPKFGWVRFRWPSQLPMHRLRTPGQRGRERGQEHSRGRACRDSLWRPSALAGL